LSSKKNIHTVKETILRKKTFLNRLGRRLYCKVESSFLNIAVK
jgi:hypothetical protein